MLNLKELVKAKQQLRRGIIKLLESQSQEDRSRASGIIASELFERDEFKRARIIMFYISTDSEVNTRDMIRHALSAGKTIAVPVSKVEEKKLFASQLIDVDKELEPGPYGILQPKEDQMREIDPGQIELVIVPGIAFDKTGRRLGRGKGYYDRFLASIPNTTPKVGLAFRFQIVDEVPCSPHDFPLTAVISN